MGRLPGGAVDFAPALVEQLVLRVIPENANSWEAGQTRGGKGSVLVWGGLFYINQRCGYTPSLELLELLSKQPWGCTPRGGFAFRLKKEHLLTDKSEKARWERSSGPFCKPAAMLSCQPTG